MKKVKKIEETKTRKLPEGYMEGYKVGYKWGVADASRKARLAISQTKQEVIEDVKKEINSTLDYGDEYCESEAR